MARLWTNSIRGKLTSDDDTTLTADIFAELPVVSSPDTLRLTLDPQREKGLGKPEIVEVTAHSASSKTVTVTRGVETGNNGASKTSWPSGTTVVHALTSGDADEFVTETSANATYQRVHMEDVTKHGAVGDGTTDDTQALINARTAAGTDGTVFYPDGDYNTTASIADLHGPQMGPGRILRDGANAFHPDPGRTDQNTLYVRDNADAADTNDGLSVDYPLRQVSAAFALLDAYGPFLAGEWTIDVGAGTYTGGSILPESRGGHQHFVKVIGATDASNIPTVLIDHAADTAETYGFLSRDDDHLWLEDVKIIGSFDQGLKLSRNTRLEWRNVHIDGPDVGMAIHNDSRYFAQGGIVENCASIGIEELFGITRAINQGGDPVTIQNCGVGLKAKENCRGHLDDLIVQDCDEGVELQAWTTANVSTMTLNRNAIGIVLVNSEIHAEDSIVWGTGADANTRRILSLGNSSEIAYFGWDSPGVADTLRTGHRPLVTVGADYSDVNHTGTTTETDIYVPGGTTNLRGGWHTVEGKRARLIVWGTTVGALTASVRTLLRIGGQYVAEFEVPAGVADGIHWHAFFDVICSADGNNQKIIASLTMEDGSTDVRIFGRTLDLSGDSTVKITSILNDSSDEMQYRIGELYA